MNRGSRGAAWRCLDVFFLLIIVEGAIRKWIAPGIGVPLQVFRDLLPFTALLLVANDKAYVSFLRVPKFLPPLLSLYFILGVLQTLNPSLPDILVAVLGLRTHFAYVPLFFLIPGYLGNLHQTLNKFSLLIMLAIPIMVLAAYQSMLAPSHWLNTYASGEQANALYGDLGLVRATGTFAYITGFQVFSQTILALSWALLLPAVSKQLSVRRFWLIWVGFSAALIGCVASGSRGALMSAFALSVLVFVVYTRRNGLRLRFIPILTLGTVGALYGGYKQVAAFYDRTINVSSDLQNRIWLLYFEWLEPVTDNPLGYGIGAAHQQAGSLVGQDLGFGLGYENELTRVAQELGIFGFLVFFWLKVAMITYSWHQQWRVVPALASLAAFFTGLVILGLNGSVYTPIANAVYWSAIGGVLWCVLSSHRQRVLDMSSWRRRSLVGAPSRSLRS